MKKTRFILLLTALLAAAHTKAQDGKKTPPEAPKYDSLLAAKLGADAYGMKTYVMAFLRRGPVKLTDSSERARLQKAHMDNIGRMADEGKLVVAGPFLDNQDIRGIYVFNVSTVEEARQLTGTDPAIKAGTLVMELHPWYGSAALLETLRIHNTIQKQSF